ncbi:TniQ family protein [Streptomyces sp. NPDC001027]|uniref:TniQ family protein n=1 Tax=Streptomyces sp. NPDC001027 TaxID=3154771 RepID=UPI00331A043D
MTEHLPLPLAPLPINVRPRLGESTDHYIQRLARANHLRPSELLQHLTPPPHKTGRRPQLSRLAALSGRPADVLENTLADAGPAAEPTPSDLRLQHHPELHDNNGHNITSLVKHNARRNKNGLRQIADTWKIPLWLLRRVLNPRFPDPKPPLRASMSEDTYRTIWEHYLQGATPTQTWHNLLDDHVDWIPLTTVTKLFLRFSEENDAAELNERGAQTS